MKTGLLLLPFLALANVWSAQALAAETNSTSTTIEPLPWNTSRAHWDEILKEPRSFPSVQLGKSDIAVSGPLLDGFRGKRVSSDASRWSKFVSLPVVNLLVPQKMPSPPTTGGSYFAWRNNSRSWSELARGVPAGSPFSPANNEPVGTLISFRIGSSH